MDRGRAGTIVESRSFQLFIAAVICVNAITIGFETLKLPAQVELMLDLFDIACLGVYVVEAYLKLTAYGNAYFKDGWNVFDFTIGRKALVKSAELKGLAASNADIDSNGEIGIADMVRLEKYLLGMTKSL